MRYTQAPERRRELPRRVGEAGPDAAPDQVALLRETCRRVVLAPVE